MIAAAFAIGSSDGIAAAGLPPDAEGFSSVFDVVPTVAPLSGAESVTAKYVIPEEAITRSRALKTVGQIRRRGDFGGITGGVAVGDTGSGASAGSVTSLGPVISWVASWSIISVRGPPGGHAIGIPLNDR